jgi:hypothetical protein
MLLVTTAVAGMTIFEMDTPLWIVGATFFVMGAGMANVMPPATESVMASLPREKAGVGSAVNNTIRQVGGSLGVAVLGSVLASSYRSAMAEPVSSLPEPVRHAASESVAGAYGVAEALGPAGRALIAPANAAFIDAMHLTAIFGAAVGMLGALVVLLWLPRRSAPVGPFGPAVPAGAAPDGAARPDRGAVPAVAAAPDGAAPADRTATADGRPDATDGHRPTLAEVP